MSTLTSITLHHISFKSLHVSWIKEDITLFGLEVLHVRPVFSRALPSELVRHWQAISVLVSKPMHDLLPAEQELCEFLWWGNDSLPHRQRPFCEGKCGRQDGGENSWEDGGENSCQDGGEGRCQRAAFLVLKPVYCLHFTTQFHSVERIFLLSFLITIKYTEITMMMLHFISTKSNFTIERFPNYTQVPSNESLLKKQRLAWIRNSYTSRNTMRLIQLHLGAAKTAPERLLRNYITMSQALKSGQWNYRHIFQIGRGGHP